MRKVSREEILSGNPVKIMFQLGLPIMISQILFTFYNMADTFWLGHLPSAESGSAVAGLQVAFPIVWFLISFTLGFGFAGVALVSQYTGANDHKNANHAASQVLSFLTIAGILVAIFGYFVMPIIAHLITNVANVSATAIKYMKVYVIGIPFLFVSAAFQNILSAKGDNVTPMQISLVTNVMNIILDPFLIFGWWIFPRLTVVGAAVATVITEGVAAIIAVYFLFKGTKGIKVSLSDLKIELSWFLRIFKIGFPAAVGNSGTSLGFVVLTALIGRLPNAEIALSAYGIGDRAIHIIFVVVEGIGAAIVTMIGQNLGAGLIERAEKISKEGIKLEFVITLIESAFIFVIRNAIYKVFIPGNMAVIQEGSKFLTIFILGLPFFGLFSAVSGVFRGSGHNVEPMIGDLLRLWGLRLPLSYLLSRFWGSSGIWWGMTLSNIIAAVVLYVFYTFGKWKVPIIKKEEIFIEESAIITGSE
ncbi:MATE family efflux transporter [Caldisericum exile]|uniref:MatE family transporter n=1 Tax=Caldisericum exile (strain DSM 21853 / NBRC 104410 / AZM16c01) TaxID=511051 RepID=A0A7U6JFZ9_CALEA|nr:MATE family efflux transporter [Caldisericum exile]BAL80825.1 putative MatE family transporter [Caldisericum exile AZM16c01]